MRRVDIHRFGERRSQTWHGQTFPRQRQHVLLELGRVHHGWILSEHAQELHEILIDWSFRLEIRHRRCHRCVCVLWRDFLASLIEFRNTFKGDSSNQIHFEGYQVSNQCCSLVRDECIIPTLDAPQLAYIRESSNEKYIPDVYYRVGWEKNT